MGKIDYLAALPAEIAPGLLTKFLEIISHWEFEGAETETELAQNLYACLIEEVYQGS